MAAPIKKQIAGDSYWSISVDFKQRFKTIDDIFMTRETVQKIAEKIKATETEPSTEISTDGWKILEE